jgi:hypothetical protein
VTIRSTRGGDDLRDDPIVSRDEPLDVGRDEAAMSVKTSGQSLASLALS